MAAADATQVAAPEDAVGVSVVIPCHNAATTVGRAIDSVLAQHGGRAGAQTGPRAEIIAVDDGSTDATLSVLRGYGDRIQCDTGPNRGACAARNRGLARARGAAVLFLDADDYLGPGSLAALATTLARTGADLAIGRVVEASLDGTLRAKRGPATASPHDLLVSWLEGDWVPPCAVLWRTEAVRRLDGWAEGLTKNQDGELMMRAAVAGLRAADCPYAMATYDHGAAGPRISRSPSARAQADVLDTLTGLQRAVAGTALETDALRRALCGSLHRLEMHCLRGDHDAVAREARRARATLGVGAGSGLHRAVTALLGPKRKERLSRALWRMRGVVHD